MTLMDCTITALDFTRRLQSAVNLDDMDLCQEILELRGQAMLAFEAAHRASGALEKARCQDQITALIEADRKLQADMASELEAIAVDFRKHMVTSHLNQHSGYQELTSQACVDRKA